MKFDPEVINFSLNYLISYLILNIHMQSSLLLGNLYLTDLVEEKILSLK